MTATRQHLWVRRAPIAVMFLLAMALLYAGQAGAMYLSDGAKQTGPGTYDNPDDGFCVIGIKANGDMLVDKNITNARDCVAYTNNLTSLNTQALCAPVAVPPTLPVSPTTGWRHLWSTSVCTTTGAGGGTGVSRVDLDNTAAMCTSKGGIIGPACIAYGWFYRGLKSDQTVIPITGSPAAAPFDTSNYAVWQGATSTDGLGFCYAAMDFTNAVAPAYTRPGTGVDDCPMLDPLNPSGRQRTLTSGWSDYYWNWNFAAGAGPTPVSIPLPTPIPATGTKCRNAYGVKADGTTGKLDAAITSSVAGNAYTTSTAVDLTTGFNTQGFCIANGFSWENWVPKTPGGFVDAATRGVLSATACTGGSANCYAAMDLTTLQKDGGAKFTSRQCQRCHSDQSRGPAERDKPGFVKHGHKLSGDSTDPMVAAIGNTWGTKGVVCSVCHASANPQVPDIIQEDATGAKKYTNAHEVSQYGAAVTQVCYTCHSDATAGPTGGTGGSTTPAAVIPVSSGDFKKNAQHNAPIVNQFLNSPHAQYSGTNSGADLQSNANYNSGFVGYLCRVTGPFAGDILTTVYRNGVAELIPNLDETSNAACTNPGNGSATSGAAGFWVPEGSAASNSQGNCMTCHDPHWSLTDTNPEAEPFRRECATCHSESGGASASGAPQIDLTTINHLNVTGGPLVGVTSDPATWTEACETCHMPESSSTGSPMHLWRINTDPAYQTMGATQANTDSNGAAWVDLEHSCGQCHGGGTVQDAQHMPVAPALYRTNAQLALVAEGMHSSAGITYATTFSTATVDLTVNMYASVICNGTCSLTYDWDCGTGGTLVLVPLPAATATCTYATSGTKTITLTVMEGGGQVGKSTRSVTVSAPIAPPVPGGLGGVGCPSLTFAADTWTASFTDASTPAGSWVLVEWGDGSVELKVAGAAFSHQYKLTGPFLLVQKVLTNALQLAVAPPCTVNPVTFQIDGHVYKSDATSGLGSATVTVRSSTTGATVRTVYTTTTGYFSVASLKPDTYWLIVKKRGYTFTAPADVVTVGGDKLNRMIVATSP